MAKTVIDMNKRLTYKQQLALSEQRNVGLAKYLKAIEDRCKQILVAVSNKYDELGMVLTPESQEFRGLLADICRWLAPICTDVENMKLPDGLYVQGGAQMDEESAEVVRVQTNQDDPAEPESDAPGK